MGRIDMKFYKCYRDCWKHSDWAYKFKKETKQLTYTFEEFLVKLDEPNHWLDNFLDGMQDAIYMPLDFIHSVNIYIINRFQARTHLLKSNLEKGVWHEYSERITKVISDSFIDWMETEYAGSSKPNPEKLIEKHLWEISLKYDEHMGVEYYNIKYMTPTHQAIKAKTLFEIYQYWKYQRPAMVEDEYEELKSDTKYLNMIIENRDSMWT